MKLKFFVFFFITLNFPHLKAFEVMSWVSPYYVPDSKIALESSFGGISVKSTLTRLGLQFWNIHSNGNVTLLNVTDADTKWFITWGKQNNVKILLTVVNDGSVEHGYNGFDWTLVRSACYGETSNTTIKNLLAIVDEFDLDGVDLDFEGEDGQGGPFINDDKINYSIFVNRLTDSLHVRGKLCTVDTYPSDDYGAPKPSWWGLWKNTIDAIHTMGYTSSYWSCPTQFSYQGQQDLAGIAGIEPQKVLMGMPMWVNNWAGGNDNTGKSNVENLNFILNCLTYQTGITLWDIHYPVAFIDGTSIHPWSADSVWHLMKAIHDGQDRDITKCPHVNSSGKIIDDMSNRGLNLKGGVWSAFSDNWSRVGADLVNSTKVLIPDLSYDMALGEGTYGDITKGYFNETDNGSFIKSTIKTIGKAGTDAANGGFVMNFLPVDPLLDPSAQLWEVAKIGVERDLSSYKKLVVGAQCSVGKTIRIYLRTKAQLKIYDAPYSESFTCTGNYEDYELTFATLKPLWGIGPIGFDAAHALQLTIDYIDPNPPNTINLNIAGVAVDTSVISFHPILTSVSSFSQKNSELSNPIIYFADKNGINFNDECETEIRLMTVDGKIIFNKKTNNKYISWDSPLPTGIFLLQIIRNNHSGNFKIKL